MNAYTLSPSDTFMSKTARLYSDTRTASAAADAAPSNLDKLNGELQDVTRIMTKNMEELLWRGDSLDSELLPYFENMRMDSSISMLSKDISLLTAGTMP